MIGFMSSGAGEQIAIASAIAQFRWPVARDVDTAVVPFDTGTRWSHR
jgi:hypothetical protein